MFSLMSRIKTNLRKRLITISVEGMPLEHFDFEKTASSSMNKRRITIKCSCKSFAVNMMHVFEDSNNARLQCDDENTTRLMCILLLHTYTMYMHS